MDAVAYFLFFYSINVRIDFVQLVIVAILMNLLYFVPSPPGSIGSTEWYFILLFQFGLKIPRDIVSSTAILVHFISSVLIVLIGLVCTSTLGVKFSQVFKKAQKEEYEINNNFKL